MAWKISTTNENKYRPGLELHPEDDASYRAEKKAVTKAIEAELGQVVSYTGILNGLAYPLPDHPFRFQVDSNHKVLPNFLSARISWAIPQNVVDAIEALEPGVHRYWPVDITMKDGSKAEPRWLLNICTRLDTISVERSNVVVLGSGMIRPSFNTMEVRHKGGGPKHLVCRKDRIGNHAIWCEYRYGGGPVFISNAMAEVFRNLGPEGLDFDLEAAEI